WGRRVAAASRERGAGGRRCRRQESPRETSPLQQPALFGDGADRLVENLEPFEGGRLVDRERRVDPDGRRVGHRDEPSPQAFLEELLGDVPPEKLLRLAILHELDGEEQALPAHVADDPVLLLQGLETPEHDGPDARGILDEVLSRDDLERRQARRGGERVASVARRASARVRERLVLRQLVRRDEGRQRKAA